MRRQIREKRVKQILDILIILCGIAFIFFLFKEMGIQNLSLVLFLAAVAGMGIALHDFMFLCGGQDRENALLEQETYQPYKVQRLILLDDQGKPVKSWDLQGKVSFIIGKAGQGQELDIDLSDCEYSSFIDFQHAVLNFCLDQWYVEDLGSQNGVKIRKVEDGECYKVIHRPCKVAAGDILYIANTKLLLT